MAVLIHYVLYPAANGAPTGPQIVAQTVSGAIDYADAAYTGPGDYDAALSGGAPATSYRMAAVAYDERADEYSNVVLFGPESTADEAISTAPAVALARTQAAQVISGRLISTSPAVALARTQAAQVVAGRVIGTSPAAALARTQPAQVITAPVIGTTPAAAVARGQPAQILAPRPINAAPAVARARTQPAVLLTAREPIGTSPAIARAFGCSARVVSGRVIGARPAVARARGAPARVTNDGRISTIQPYVTVYMWLRVQ